MAKLTQLVAGCAHPAAPARFWAAWLATVHESAPWTQDPSGNDFWVADHRGPR